MKMVSFIVSFSVCLFIMFMIFVALKKKKEKEENETVEKKTLDNLIWERYQNTLFNIPKFMEKVEKTTLSILEQKEHKAENMEIILWWGLDGLRLNFDGTTEWIDRREKRKNFLPEKTPALYDGFPIQQCNAVNVMYPHYMTFDQIPCAQMQMQIMNSINCLQMQSAQQIQNALLTQCTQFMQSKKRF